MIIKDENDGALSVESLSDITKEINEIEAIFSKAIANKKKGGSMPQEEKDELKARMEDLNAVMSTVGKEMQEKAKPMELISFIKALAKLKKVAEAGKSELKE
ncbi:MAG: hypothetical protein IJ447_01865 [Clostridia bacterium]|nr:hypothetical protein [Clostridia bacterium]